MDISIGRDWSITNFAKILKIETQGYSETRAKKVMVS